jgi:hypothetical protein
MDIIKWTIDNKEWLFSGAGTVIILTIMRWMVRKPSRAQQQRSDSGSQNIQAGRDMTIINASPGLQETKQSSDDVLASMPKLTTEMKAALLAPGGKFIREFFVLPHRRLTIGGSQKPRFIFYEDEHQSLRGQLDVLEEHGFIKDVTPSGNDYPIYRMTEKLVSCLIDGNFDK